MSKANDAISSGNVSKAARNITRANLRLDRDIDKTEAKRKAAKAKAVKRVATKTSDKANRAYAKAERREDRANKYVGGGKVVAQGSDKKDIRREKKQDRMESRAVKATKREDRKRRNKGYRQLKKDIRTGKINPFSDNLK